MLSSASSLILVSRPHFRRPRTTREKPSSPQPAALHANLKQISQDSAVVRLLTAGEKSASVCRHCHGVGGNSVLPEVPNLASQNSAYLLEQMNKFVRVNANRQLHGRTD